MSKTTQKILEGVGLALIVIAIYGAYKYPLPSALSGAVGTPGGTGSTQKSASIVWAPTVTATTTATNGTATTTSILNSDASDRFIQSVHYACTGLQAATSIASTGLVITSATTSVSQPQFLGNTNYVLDPSDSVATSTGYSYLASTTPGITTTISNRLWASGSNLSFAINATVSAGSCTIGVNYLSL